MTDDPSLTDRSGLPRRRPLIPVILDEKVRLLPTVNLARMAFDRRVVLFGEADSPKATELRALGVEIADSNGGNLRRILEELGRQLVQSVLVEGGATVAGEFVEAGLVNKVTFFIAPKIVGGTQAPSAIGGVGIERMAEALELERVAVVRRGADIEVTGYPRTTEGNPSDEG